MREEDFFRIFKTDIHAMEHAVATAMSGGGDWCDLYFEYSVYNDLMLRDGEVNSGGYHEDFGVGIRVLDGEKTGYAYSESTGKAEMEAAAKAAAAIALRSGRHDVPPFRVPGADTSCTSHAPHRDLYPVGRTWDMTDHSGFLGMSDLFPFLKD